MFEPLYQALKRNQLRICQRLYRVDVHGLVGEQESGTFTFMFKIVMPRVKGRPELLFDGHSAILQEIR